MGYFWREGKKSERKNLRNGEDYDVENDENERWEGRGDEYRIKYWWWRRDYNDRNEGFEGDN